MARSIRMKYCGAAEMQQMSHHHDFTSFFHQKENCDPKMIIAINRESHHNRNLCSNIQPERFWQNAEIRSSKSRRELLIYEVWSTNTIFPSLRLPRPEIREWYNRGNDRSVNEGLESSATVI